METRIETRAEFGLKKNISSLFSRLDCSQQASQKGERREMEVGPFCRCPHILLCDGGQSCGCYHGILYFGAFPSHPLIVVSPM